MVDPSAVLLVVVPVADVAVLHSHCASDGLHLQELRVGVICIRY